MRLTCATAANCTCTEPIVSPNGPSPVARPVAKVEELYE